MQTPTGILLINLGTPDAPTTKAVRRYLREFLSDPRVIDLPFIVRSVLVNGVIAPFRSPRSAKAYREIWSEHGSPLLMHSQNLKHKLANKLGNDYIVELGMRYGQPSIQSALDNLLQQHCAKIIVLPLFPQYSSAANGSAIEATFKAIRQSWNMPEINVVNNFHDHPAFIQTIGNKIKQTLDETQPDLLLMSYHGLPVRHITKSNAGSQTHFCYRTQCYNTSKLIAEHLDLNNSLYRVAFQSRLGRTPWIEPYTDMELPKLADQGVKNLAVVCPSFVADCLETLEEIGIRAREQWQKLGGKSFHLIPCLNDDDAWVDAIADITHR